MDRSRALPLKSSEEILLDFKEDVNLHTCMTHSLLSPSTTGDFGVVNFRDTATTGDLDNQTVTFEFEFDTMFPLSPLNPSLVGDVRLTWRQISGFRSGVILSGQVERVGQTGTYRLSVPLRLLGEGRLLVNLNMNILCSSFFFSRFSSRRTCSQWLIRVTSDPLEISDKRG